VNVIPPLIRSFKHSAIIFSLTVMLAKLSITSKAYLNLLGSSFANLRIAQ
jgi:hypothetical protein